MLSTIQRVLERIAAPGRFISRHLAPASSLRIQVEGVGRIQFPISRKTAHALCAIAEPAQFGLRDQTLLDTKVRNTWELKPKAISIDDSWTQSLDPILRRVHADLGLPQGGSLRAELHNMLIYEPGQFFLLHQDSEKSDGMVATLVVTLPSQFVGGELVVAHFDEQEKNASDPSQLSLVAFYADCPHEVRPVLEGFRIALTYNLILDGVASTPPHVEGEHVEELCGRLREYFESRRGNGSLRASAEPPDRFVYLLDHQYTERSLGWKGLKNADTARAAVLRAAAVELDCEVVLALADVHESWSCEEWYDSSDEEFGYGYDRRRVRQAPGDLRHPPLVEMIESTVELHHAISTMDQPVEPFSALVFQDEFCTTAPSESLGAYRLEHEGYLGNYGNTVDRWYHRAAVVLWPRERTFVIRSKESAAYALSEVERTLQGGRTTDARSMVERILPFWKATVQEEEMSSLVQTALRVAEQIDDGDLAASLLAPFPLATLGSEFAVPFIALSNRYGDAWCSDLFEEWRPAYVDEERLAWFQSFPTFIEKLCAEGSVVQRGLAKRAVMGAVSELGEHVKTTRKDLMAKGVPELLKKMSGPILALLESAIFARVTAAQKELLSLLVTEECAGGEWITEILRKARETDSLAWKALEPVRRFQSEAISALVERPARSPGDWSMEPPRSCSCADCKELKAFLKSSERWQMEWPLAKQRRAHIHGLIDRYGLPVVHTTKRSGSPHRLILMKTRELFDREADERVRWTKDLEWLMPKTSLG